MVWTERQVSVSACVCERCRKDVSNGRLDILKSRYHAIFEYASDHYDTLRARLHKMDHFLELLLLREEGKDTHTATDNSVTYGRLIPRGLIVDYASLSDAFKLDSSEVIPLLPCDAVIVTFPLHPKPHHEEAQSTWLRSHWNEDGLPT